MVRRTTPIELCRNGKSAPTVLISFSEWKFEKWAARCDFGEQWSW